MQSLRGPGASRNTSTTCTCRSRTRPRVVRKRGHIRWGGRRGSGRVASPSRLLEVACAVVTCVLGRSPSVPVDDSLLPVAEVERVGDSRAAARALDPAPSFAAAAVARGGPAGLGCVESGAAASGLVDFLGQSANAASLAPAAGGAPLDIPASPARTSTCRSRHRGSRHPPRAGEPSLGLPANRR